MRSGDFTNGVHRPAALPPDFRVLFESSPGMYLVLSTDFTIIAATDAYLRLTRTQRSRILGRKIPSVFPASDNSGNGGIRNLATSLHRVLSTGAPDTMALQRFEIPATGSDGGGFEERFWSVVNTPVLDPDGNVCWIIHCVEDATELVRLKLASCEREMAAKQLREANAELAALYEKTRELDSLKTSFLANVGDELRTALPLILGPMEEARREVGTLQGDALFAVSLHSRRLLKRINALLDFARIEGGRIDLVPEPTNLSLLTQKIVEPFRSIIENDGLAFIVDCPPLPEEVYVDRSVWEKIVVSLVFNAFRFTFEGSIGVSVEYRPDQVLVLFRDTGNGILEDELPFIFERFHQMPGGRAAGFGRPGVGLPQVRELVQQHGGSIEVWSEQHRGTTIQVALPTGWRSAETLLSRGGHPAESHILLVDDHDRSRNELSLLLSAHFRLTIAENADAALAAIRSDLPDLIVSNVTMPILGRLALVQNLKFDPLTAAIPVILLSADGGEEAATSAIESGADDYLTLPFSDPEVLIRVRTHLKLARLQRATATTANELADWRAELRQKEEVTDGQPETLSTPQLNEISIPHIRSLIDVLESDFGVSLDASCRNYLSSIVSAAKEVESLLDRMAAFSRLNKAEMTKTSINLRSLVQEVLRQFTSPGGPPTNWTLGSLPCVHANAEMLRLVLVNLISNALKFSAQCAERRIEIAAAESADGGVVFLVRDNGVGFSAEQAERLFEVFQRLHSHEEFEGMGIGLAIVKRIIQRHGGRTWATGTVGEGATFFCSLPPVTGVEQI